MSGKYCCNVVLARFLGAFGDSVDQDQTEQNVLSDLDLHCPIIYFYFPVEINLEIENIFVLQLYGNFSFHSFSSIPVLAKRTGHLFANFLELWFLLKVDASNFIAQLVACRT